MTRLGSAESFTRGCLEPQTPHSERRTMISVFSPLNNSVLKVFRGTSDNAGTGPSAEVCPTDAHS